MSEENSAVFLNNGFSLSGCGFYKKNDRPQLMETVI